MTTACALARENVQAGGYAFPGSVATDAAGGVYVADDGNDRVQRVSPQGRFEAMFGLGVKRTATGGTTRVSEGRGYCSAAASDTCGPGLPGTGAGALTYPGDVAVDPRSGDVYVIEVAREDYRLDRFTASGGFLWMTGGSVNRTTGASLCTASEVRREHARCGPGAEAQPAGDRPAAFKFAQHFGNLLAVGGPDNLVYVGDEHRVQEFDSNGSWRGEILLVSLSAAPYSDVTALTLDRAGDLYLVYRVAGEQLGTGPGQPCVIRKFDRRGEQVAEIPVYPRGPDAQVEVIGLAMDAEGQLVAIGSEVSPGSVSRFGYVYDPTMATVLSRFQPPGDFDGLAINAQDDVYIAAAAEQDVAIYVPGSSSALLSEPVGCAVAQPCWQGG